MNTPIKYCLIVALSVAALCMSGWVSFGILSSREGTRLGTARVRIARNRMLIKAPAVVDTVILHPNRGDILDCNGKVLVTDKVVYNIRMDACVDMKDQNWPAKAGSLAKGLSVIFQDRTSKEYLRIMTSAREDGRRYINPHCS